MSTAFPQVDGSILLRADGCAPDFLQRLDEHHLFLSRYFAPDNGFLDHTLASVQHLDARLKAGKEARQPFPRAFVDGAIAYCGEVLRALTGGTWSLHAWPADQWGGVRYFASIDTPSGQRIAVGMLVEGDVERDGDSRLYLKLRLETSPSFLSVTKTHEHPAGDQFFPRLSDLP
ncbi:hypothetical protein GCM10027594_25460 [Hymenobacter agri]